MTAVPIRIPVSCECRPDPFYMDVMLEPGIQIAEPSITCQTCGVRTTAHGIFEAEPINGVLTTVVREATPEDLAELAAAMEQLREAPDVTPEQVADTLDATGSDVGARLAEWVRRNGGWVPILALIVAVLSLLQAYAAEPGATPEQIEKIVDDVTSQYDELQPASPGRPRPGRNEPCWCGAGKKYKHCHGRPQSVIDRERRGSR